MPYHSHLNNVCSIADLTDGTSCYDSYTHACASQTICWEERFSSWAMLLNGMHQCIQHCTAGNGCLCKKDQVTAENVFSDWRPRLALGVHAHHGLIFMSGIGAHVKKTVSRRKDFRPHTSDSAPIRGALRNDSRPCEERHRGEESEETQWKKDERMILGAFEGI